LLSKFVHIRSDFEKLCSLSSSMKPTERVRSIEAAKILGDPRRLNILRLLMRGPATLSQLGKELSAHPAKVRHHLKLLEDSGFIMLESKKTVRGIVEKYYEATAKAYLVNLSILPEQVGKNTIVMMGSHDLALEILTERMRTSHSDARLFCVPIGSLDGLIALRQGLCHIAGCHLPDSAGDNFNVSHVQHLFPDKSMALISVGYRQQGILTRKGNPKGILEVHDLAREDIAFVNRQSGSGTRLWLDRRLSASGVPQDLISGYDREVKTHHQVGQAIARGEVDAGIGLMAEAKKMDLDFSPLFEERFDLVLPVDELSTPAMRPIFDRLASGDFRRRAAMLGGYDTKSSGDMTKVGLS
jgi:molybdate-binding protein/DNA-binding HxlR family transcriptional regulator